MHGQSKSIECGTDAIHQKLMNEDPTYKRNFDNNTVDWQKYATEHLGTFKTGANKSNTNETLTQVTTLSVVFHDVSNNSNYLISSGDISDYQYIIDKLNLVYNGTNVNTHLNEGNNTFIQFCLAKRKQDGVAYTLADSHVQNIFAANLDPSAPSQHSDIVLASATAQSFNPKNYINVYIVDNIEGVSGFAYGPSSVNLPYDGIYVEREYLDATNPNFNSNMEVLTHEMGHYLGLLHLFGICSPTIINSLTVNGYNPCSCDNGNCLFNGDMVCDTPPSMYLQPDWVITTTLPNTCSTDNIALPASMLPYTNPLTSNIPDAKDNYMDYGVWSYQRKFTEGQILRMQFAIDPVYGSRKLLRGQSFCEKCAEMSSCSFSIQSNPVMQQIDFIYPARFGVAQVGGVVPTGITLSLNNTCVGSPNLTYAWSLQSSGGVPIIVPSGTGSQYVLPQNLSPGNYQITFTATLISNPQCFESTTYDFTVVPEAGPCILNVPNANSLPDWIAEGWMRNSYTNGWHFLASLPLGCIYGNNFQPNFDSTGFDVVTLVGGKVGPTDTLLGNYSIPTANVSKVMRIGQKGDQGGGKAYYATKVLTINRHNCRFKVWILGATQGAKDNTVMPFHNVYNGINDAAFGISSVYNYYSTVNNTAGELTTSGEQIVPPPGGSINKSNRFISQTEGISSIHPSGTTYNITANGNIAGWTSVILDYSDYVDLDVDTQITITFFAHSNMALSAIQNAYSYYGIECLGGGIPEDFDFSIPDVHVACSSPGTQSCAVINLPKPSYCEYIGPTIAYNNSGYKLTNVKVYKKNQVTGLFNLISPEFDSSAKTMKICLDQTEAPFQEYKMVYRTLHQEIVKYFKIYVGFYNSLPECPAGTEGDVIDTNFHPADGDIFLCDSTNLPMLHITSTCVIVPHTYQWYRVVEVNGPDIYYEIVGATNELLQLAYDQTNTYFSIGSPTITHNYMPYSNCNTYVRRTIFNEPYCFNPQYKESPYLHVYNAQALFMGLSAVSENDLCFPTTDSYTLTFNPYIGDSHTGNNACVLPAHFTTDPAFANSVNHLNFQLFDPATQQPFGNIISYTFTGPLYNIPPMLPMQFVFNNDNPSLPGTPLFTPTATVNSFPYSLLITGNYLGCQLDSSFAHNYKIGDINFSDSAVGGKIGYNCVFGSDITSIEDGVTGGGIYGWEYSIGNSNSFSPIPNAPGTSTLPFSYINSLGNNYPIFIRRKSNGFSFCPLPQYSNTVIITNNVPSSPIFSTSQLPSTLCKGATVYTLPGISQNGVIGTWSPSTVNNQHSGLYVFTPLAGYCLPTYNYNLTIIEYTVPAFTQIEPICAGENFSLPEQSLNQINGSWSPFPVNNTTTTEYTFHVTGGGIETSCYAPVKMNVIVNPVAVVDFTNSTIFSPICKGGSVPILPLDDNNGLPGTWEPSTVNNLQTTTYTFTPYNTCTPPATYTIGVKPCGFTLTWGSDVSCQTADDIKLYDANIEDGPCLKVCENSLITYELHGEYSTIASTDWNVTGGSVVTQANTNCGILWNGNSSTCDLQVIIHLNGGGEIIINKCFQKLEAPNALFGIAGVSSPQNYTACSQLPINFNNLSTSDNGDDNLYYNWFFGDGATSHEFEPTHTYESSGEYEVTLVVYNGCSCAGTYSMIIHVESGNIEIDCPSVVCEGAISDYNIDPGYNNCPDLTWSVQGGTILSQQNNNAIQVLWDNVDADGFGYISVTSPNCSHCISKVKIPVVKQVGTINGDLTVCEKSQNVYSLPQWPTTDFHWTLNANGTNAFLILNTQRNEIVLQANSAGIVDLYCNYQNTLLGCSGTAHITVHVISSAHIYGVEDICQGQGATYQIKDQFGNLISGTTWIAEGPGMFSQTGTTNPFTLTFYSAGTYSITSADSNHCNLSPLTVNVRNAPAAPTAIDGPLVVCPGVPVTYNCTVGDGFTAHWNVVNGTIIGSDTGDSILVNFNSNATTPFVVKVYYEHEGCISSQLATTIARDIPDLTVIQKSLTVCGSSYADYAINNVNADNYTWIITPSTAGTVASGQNSPAAHILWNQLAQTATVSLQFSKCGQTYSIAPISVTIINAPSITISGPSSICSLQNASFSVVQNPAGTFTNLAWDFGDGAQSGTNVVSNISHPYQTPIGGSANYTVTATMSGGNGCITDAHASFNIIVSPSPVVSITPVSDVNLCGTGDPSNFIYHVNVQGGFASTDLITWYKNGVPIPNLTGVAPDAAALDVRIYHAGTYYATVTNSFGCTSTTTSIVAVWDCSGCSTPEGLDASVSYDGCQSIAAIATLLPAGYTSAEWHINLPGATISPPPSPTYFHASNIAPGKYPLRFQAHYDNQGVDCIAYKDLTITIPYKPDLKYQITCETNNTYHVTLIDFSTYYPETPIFYYWFTIDNGTNWHQGTLSQGINQYVANLAPGNYNVGIKIYTPGIGYYECQKIITLKLPPFPTANFTHSTTAMCKNSPMQFFTSSQPNCTYTWDFLDGSSNLQQNPEKSYPAGPKQAKLTVTNQYGCSAFSVQSFVINDYNMQGIIQASPNNVCDGGQITLHYNPANGTSTPVQYIWYQGTVTAAPYNTTYPPSPNLVVTESDYYLVYVVDNHGCKVSNTAGVSATFIPNPEAPVISGDLTACVNSAIHLSVPINSNVVYYWYRNGVLQSQWNNANSVVDFQSVAGIYTYSVIAKVLASGTTYCSSLPGTFEVKVVTLPDMPVLSSVVSCDPYQVSIEVTNPQVNAGYFWSNGDLGTTAIMNHDGPIQVRAELNNCIVKTQIDLPIDINPLLWIFPKGCYQFCGVPEGYILGPLGSFDHYVWVANHHALVYGQGTVPNLGDLHSNVSYDLDLSNGYCETGVGTMSIESFNCVDCHYHIDVTNIICNRINEQTVYQLTLSIDNTSPENSWANLSAAGGLGYFSPSTLNLPIGVSTHTVSFTVPIGFNGGSIVLDFTGHNGNKICLQNFEVTLPNDCETIEGCHFNNKLGVVNCVKNQGSYIYQIAIEVTNPYALNTITTLSIPSIYGNVLPASVISPPGVTMQHFYFYPSSIYTGGPLTFTIDNAIGAVQCNNSLEINMPALCETAPNCNFKFTPQSIICSQMANGQYGYSFIFTTDNSYGTEGTISLAAPNGEGYFVPNIVNIPVGGNTFTVTFFPINGFTGGDITIDTEGHVKELICLGDEIIHFPELCCPTCRTVDLNDPKITADNLLVVAPNPASVISTIFYNFVDSNAKKEIEVTDALGRILSLWNLDSSKGTIPLNCDRFAQGHYFIMMKADSKVIKSTKLIID